MNHIVMVTVGIVLLMEAMMDFRWKEIAVWRLCLYGIVICCYLLLTNQNIDFKECFFGIGIGVFFLLFAKISNEAVGYGDGAVILMLGSIIGGKDLLRILCLAFFLLMMAAMGLFVWNRFGLDKIKKKRLAFLPFLFLGYLGGIMLW